MFYGDSYPLFFQYRDILKKNQSLCTLLLRDTYPLEEWMPDDQFEFYLTKVKAGWLESRIILNGSHYDLSVKCNFSEPLKDLFHSLCDIRGLDATTKMDEEYHHLEFEWVGEGWLYFWKLTPKPNERLHLSIEFKGKREIGGAEYPVWKIDCTMAWQTLAEQVFTQASELLWLYGFTGYYDRWTKDFPAGLMMCLGHLLHNQPTDINDFSRELGYLAETR